MHAEGSPVDTRYDTAGLAAPTAPATGRRRSGTYFSLQLQFQDAARFEGSLRSWRLGALSLSRLASSPLCYRRLKTHLRDCNDEQYLVTVPRQSGIRFAQAGRETLCQPGAFLLEHGHSPYEFSYAQDNALWVLKVPGALRPAAHARPLLRAVVRRQQRRGLAVRVLCGSGRPAARAAAGWRRRPGARARRAATGGPAGLFGAGRCARAVLQRFGGARAHLCRIEDYARRHLGDRDLTPERTAQACGISTRYLHALYRDAGQTFVQWLHEQRLDRAEQALRGAPVSVASVAHQWGFADQSHFSRLFKRRYGHTPGQARRRIDDTMRGRCDRPRIVALI